MQPIFFKPVLQEKIWGGNKLHTQFGLSLPNHKIGEDWAISAHPNGMSVVQSPEHLAGTTLADLYKEYPEIFNNQQLPTFPLLIKILDAADDLSIQVHPDDSYALQHEGELGKNECWYVISAEPNSKIIYGHTAQTKKEFTERIQHQQWSELLIEIPVKAGDFFNVPSGTIHAIGKGVVILETQQSSDTTYRVYDYNRKDPQGETRPLHIQQTIEVSSIPHEVAAVTPTVTTLPSATITHYLTNHYFSVWKWSVAETLHQELDHHYYLATVISGEGTLIVNEQSYPLKKADAFILPSGMKHITVEGTLEMIVSRSEQL